MFFKTTCLRPLPVYFYRFDLLNPDRETLVSSPIERRGDLLHGMFAAKRSAAPLPVISRAIGAGS